MARDEAVEWPEWLTPEHSAIHTAVENEIVKALYHCYESADAAGMDWTTEGWISCSASNIMGNAEAARLPTASGWCCGAVADASARVRR